MLGNKLKVSVFGQSHGEAVGVVMDLSRGQVITAAAVIRMPDPGGTPCPPPGRSGRPDHRLLEGHCGAPATKRGTRLGLSSLADLPGLHVTGGPVWRQRPRAALLGRLTPCAWGDPCRFWKVGVVIGAHAQPSAPCGPGL